MNGEIKFIVVPSLNVAYITERTHIPSTPEIRNQLCLQVTRIEDCSVEFEDSITITYRIKNKDGHIIREFINVPVVVGYVEP